MMTKWTFLDYIGSTGRNYFQDWLEKKVPLNAQVAINTRLEFLMLLDEDELKRPYIGTLNQECKGLIEIRIEFKGVQYRPIACFGPERHQVTILAGAVERDSKFVPKDVCKIALERKKHINEKGRTDEHSY